MEQDTDEIVGRSKSYSEESEYRRRKNSNTDPIVVPNGHANLLGFKTVQNMGLITMTNDRFIANVVVQEIGDLGTATLQVNDEVKPKSLPCRKLPLSLQDDVKREIDNFVERNVLVPVTEPTE